MQKEKYFFYSLCAVALLIPFGFKITNSLIIVSTLLWLLSARKYFQTEWKKYFSYFLLFASMYVFNIIGLIHSDNASTAFGRLESRLSYLCFPLIILVSHLDRSHFRKIGYSFCLGTFLTTLYCFSIAWWTYYHTEPDQQSFTQLTYVELLLPLKLHPTYISLFTSFSIFFLIFDWHQNRSTQLRWWLIVIGLIYFLVMNFMIQSRAPLAAFLLVGLFVLIGYLLKMAAYRKRMIFGLILMVATAAWFISRKQESLDRFNLQLHRVPDLVLQPDSLLKEGSSTQSTIYHMRSWYCSWNLLEGSRWLTGYGSGDEKDVLNPCYQSHGWEAMAYERMNAHNEYFSAMLRNGLPELLLLLATLLLPLYWSIRQQQHLYMVFILLWLCIFFFNTLNLQSAMFFYTLFNALLFRLTYQEKERNQTS